jgi:Flp pilus assembly protein TadD
VRTASFLRSTFSGRFETISLGGGSMIPGGSRLTGVVIALMLMWLCGPPVLAANPREQPICDARADHYLVTEDYAEAVRLHREYLQKHPANALAHYHLGFAYGMTGDEAREINEYERATALGLSRWDLFLNLGIAFLVNDNLSAATDALRHAFDSTRSNLNPTTVSAWSTSGAIC